MERIPDYFMAKNEICKTSPIHASRSFYPNADTRIFVI